MRRCKCRHLKIQYLIEMRTTNYSSKIFTASTFWADQNNNYDDGETYDNNLRYFPSCVLYHRDLILRVYFQVLKLLFSISSQKFQTVVQNMFVSLYYLPAKCKIMWPWQILTKPSLRYIEHLYWCKFCPNRYQFRPLAHT